jgi:hypothetical protein
MTMMTTTIEPTLGTVAFPDAGHAEMGTAATQKAGLIRGALQALRGADALDEREELDAGSFLPWYDSTLPNVRDIKVLAGAMEIELGRRRGERLAQEGEQRGGDRSNLVQRTSPDNSRRGLIPRT